MSKGYRTQRDLTLDSPKSAEPEELYRWIRQLDRHLRRVVRDMATDIRLGNSSLEEWEEEPSVDDLEPGQRVLYDTGDEMRMYVATEETLYYITLTEVS